MTREAFFAKKYQFFIFLCLFIFIEDFNKDFTNNSRCTLAYLFLPSGFSESPTPTSARSARVKEFTKDFTKDFTEDFTKDFTNDFVGRLF